MIRHLGGTESAVESPRNMPTTPLTSKHTSLAAVLNERSRSNTQDRGPLTDAALILTTITNPSVPAPSDIGVSVPAFLESQPAPDWMETTVDSAVPVEALSMAFHPYYSHESLLWDWANQLLPVGTRQPQVG